MLMRLLGTDFWRRIVFRMGQRGCHFPDGHWSSYDVRLFPVRMEDRLTPNPTS